MESKIIQEFKGIINDVEFSNERQFKAVEFITENVEKKFGSLSNEFVKDLKESSENASEKYDFFSYSAFENSVIESLNEANSLEKFSINYENNDWKFEEMNKKLKDGKYKATAKTKTTEKEKPKREKRSRIRNKVNER